MQFYDKKSASVRQTLNTSKSRKNDLGLKKNWLQLYRTNNNKQRINVLYKGTEFAILSNMANIRSPGDITYEAVQTFVFMNAT